MAKLGLGLTAPKTTDLLLPRVARIFASHLLNELLIHGFTVEGRERLANTRTIIRGRSWEEVKTSISPA